MAINNLELPIMEQLHWDGILGFTLVHEGEKPQHRGEIARAAKVVAGSRACLCKLLRLDVCPFYGVISNVHARVGLRGNLGLGECPVTLS